MGGPRRDGPRPAVIGTCVLRQQDAVSPEALLGDELETIDRMAAAARERGWQLDLALLPEVSCKFARQDLRAAAQTFDGPRLQAFARKSREHGTYTAAPVHLLKDGEVHNSIVLLDRQGDPAGVYDKVHPVMQADGSLEFGIKPARSFPVFDLDFGRVGVQICWDVAFGAGWQAMANQDAELVLFPTNPASPVALRGYAWQHGYYIAAATVHPPGIVVDPVGQVVTTLTADREVQVVRIDLDYRVIHSNCLWEYRATEHPEYEGRIRIDWDVEAHEYLATSLDPELPIRRFMEREGLLTGRQRVRQNAELLERARSGAPVIPDPVDRE